MASERDGSFLLEEAMVVTAGSCPYVNTFLDLWPSASPVLLQDYRHRSQS